MSAEDKAQELELLDWERNNKAREIRKYKPTEQGYGAAQCEECDDPMPTTRREDGRKYCTSCQQRQEDLDRRRLRR